MNRSVLWCFVPSLCVLSLLAVVILLEMDSLSTILIPVSTGPGKFKQINDSAIVVLYQEASL